MEVDIGVFCLIVLQYVYNMLLIDFFFENIDVILCSYFGERVFILGKIFVLVKYFFNDEKVFDLVVV